MKTGCQSVPETGSPFSEELLNSSFFYDEYARSLMRQVGKFGGFNNAHAHLDRANTLDPKYLEHVGISPTEGATLSLRAKQNITGDLHRGPAYTAEDLELRMERELLRQIGLGTTKLTSFIDATPDIGDRGLLGIMIAKKLQEKYRDKIQFLIATSPIFGFKKNDNEGRWATYLEASKFSDVLGGLPEKDFKESHIGYKQHFRRVLELGIEQGKEVQFQIDQANDPRESGTETLIDAVSWFGQPKIEGQDKNEPSVWAIHSISPSGYDDARFDKMVEGMLEHNIGLICCPSAALSMRQLRPIGSPLHNSIARVLEMAEAGVRIRMGTDNICDIYIPNSDGNMLTEMKVLGTAVRFYVTNILAKWGAGIPLNEMDRDSIKKALDADQSAFADLKLGK